MESRLLSLIQTAETGDSAATEALFGALHSELHRMAGRQLAREVAGSEIGEALEKLAKADPELTTLVDMKFFCEFSFAEI